jgi:cytochrome c-type biogenesis protein
MGLRFQHHQVVLESPPDVAFMEVHTENYMGGGMPIRWLLLGAVWSPCVGPTLGAASILAAQGRDLDEVAATMLAFGLGAALPLAALGLVSREALLGWRTRLLAGGARAKPLFAIVIISIGVFVLTGLDKRVETLAVDHSPRWLTDLTTRF